MDAIEKFHAHLDLCEQCREHPFDLCPAGAVLLMATAGPSKPFSMSASVTGRAPSLPRFQSMEPTTEFGKAMRGMVEGSPIGAAMKALDIDFGELERRMVHEFDGDKHVLHTSKEKGCFLCDMGVPFKEN